MLRGNMEDEIKHKQKKEKETTGIKQDFCLSPLLFTI
jgi:hypothetical protein